MENIVIKVNGKEIKLKDFPRRVVYNVTLGLIRSLNLDENPKDITVHVKVSQEDNRDP